MFSFFFGENSKYFLIIAVCILIVCIGYAYFSYKKTQDRLKGKTPSNNNNHKSNNNSEF